MKSLVLLCLQAGLAAALLVPGRGVHFAVPAPLDLLGSIAGILGVAIALLACFQLGPELTPNPDPKPGGQVHATGLFRFVRHPIYSGLLFASLGAALRSGNYFSIATAVCIAVFFRVKAGYEERALLGLHPEYLDYHGRTPRFVPALPRPGS